MKTIYKYNLSGRSDVVGRIDKFLSVQVQQESLCVWAIVDTDKPERHFKFDIVATGFPLSESNGDKQYLGTIQLFNGSLVFHVFYTEIEGRQYELYE